MPTTLRATITNMNSSHPLVSNLVTVYLLSLSSIRSMAGCCAGPIQTLAPITPFPGRAPPGRPAYPRLERCFYTARLS